eukprot:CAMPEP_0197256776 /NCGR_PEP_ID=MMETSP1429-20130617/76528_1 /TAXON_ID=49237 /ORGANISM="Chaetoceros  sp., Strain UNC1202" /LENGTH=105 /DNA_ID=CAMNT_0042720437 /DNA_START=1 /DNA_END=315 /DNA_ORIENTATION=+
MRVEETIEDRALRLLTNSETRPNTNFKRAMLPIIPFDSVEADRVLRLALPDEYFTYKEGSLENEFRDSYECGGSSASEMALTQDSRNEWMCDEYMGDKENLLTLE